MSVPSTSLPVAALAAALVALTALPAAAAPDREEAVTVAGLATSPLAASGPGDLDWFLRSTSAPTNHSATRVDDFGNIDAGDFPLVCDIDPAVGQEEPFLVNGNQFVGMRADGGSVFFGRSTDYPLCGDWDGDGVDTPAVVRDNKFFFADTNTSGSSARTQTFGRADDFPLVGDWDGDGVDTIGVVRGNVFFLSDVPVGAGAARAQQKVRLGHVDDFPAVGDWDGDGRDDLGVVRASTWFLTRATEISGTTLTSYPVTTKLSFGRAETDLPVAGDWDGDGADTPGVVRVEF